MKLGQATGFQVIFLMFAVLLLCVPATTYIVKLGGFSGDWKALIEKGAQFAIGAIVILAFPGLRRFAGQQLSTSIPPSKRAEVAIVAIAKLPLALASIAALAAWIWASQGSYGVDRMQINVDREISNAYSPAGLVRNLFLIGIAAPVLEELVCRGFLYRAFERQWGWLASMLLTSVVFGLYHPHFTSAFVSSVVFVCVLRRTGSLWAPIIVHSVFNLSLWWPLMGQFVFPRGVVLSELATWRVHIACLAFVAIALPVYVWMSRDRSVAPQTLKVTEHAAVPQ